MKILITGVAGTGKSTIIKALKERGVIAIDLHDVTDLYFWQDKKTKEKVEYAPVHSKGWFNTVSRLCDIAGLKKMLNQCEQVVMAGTADNQAEYFPLFDKIILLQSTPETIINRMKTRHNKSGFGKTAVEQEDNIAWQKEFDPQVLAYGAIPVSTEGDLGTVVDEILELCR